MNLARYKHYGENTLSMCRTTKRASIMTMDRSSVTCGVCLDHLERAIDLHRPQMNHLNDGAEKANPAVKPPSQRPKTPPTSQITAYTDGAAEPNPGPGGYGAVVYGLPGRDAPLEISQGFRLTTNNRMEIWGVIAALESTPAHSSVAIVSDSRYVVDTMTKGWIVKWKAGNWKRGKGQPVLNDDLWQRLSSLVDDRLVQFSWVKGHSGDPGNERADALATQALCAPNLPPDSEYDGAGLAQPTETRLSWAPASQGGYWRRSGPFNLILKQFRGVSDWHGAIYLNSERKFGWNNFGANLDEAQRALEYEVEFLEP